MRNPIQSFLFVALMLCSSIQLSAQCSNINGPSAQGAPNTQVFGNDSFGQSIQGSCFSGNQITKFSFWSQGNSPTKMSLKIYEGSSQTVSGTPIHTQNDISLPPANFGGKLTIDLASPVAVQSSKTYTFVLTINSSGGGNLIAHVSDNKYSGGSLYLKKGGSGGFNSAYDLRFEVESENAQEAGCGGIELSIVSSSGNEFQVKVDASNYNHQVTNPAAYAYQTIALENGTCTSCPNVPKGGTKTWTIQGQASGTKLVYTKFTGPTCKGTTFTLN